MVTKTNNWLQYAKIAATVTVLILSIAITKGINKKRHKKYLNSNTTFVKLNADELKQNADIIDKKIVTRQKMKMSTFIKEE